MLDAHTATKCVADLYCACDLCRRDHVNHMGPILKQNRLVAHAIGYVVHGLGFYHIPHPPLPRARKESR